MEIEDLALFVQVVEQGSMSAAARRIGRTQPTVTRAIQRLERELGAAFLRRSEAGIVEVLPAGERLLVAARRILAERTSLLDDLESIAREAPGQLLIAASTIPGEYLVPRVLAGFRTLHPDITPQVLVSDTAQVVAGLRRHELDVGFLGAVPEGEPFVLEPVGEDEIVLAVPADHPFAGRPSVSFAEVAEEPLVLRETGSGTMSSLFRILDRQGLHLPLGGATILGSTHAQVAAIRAGLGVGFTSSWAVAQAEGVTPVAVDGIDGRRTLYLAYEQGHLTSPAVRAFVDYVRSWALAERGL